tara:strand:+ start:63 stop:674 length:612 start_codon:yes stop_codon:yes gene_type:complete
MKLTEAKLKQMIVEAIKKKRDGTRFVDFGIPTPDEKLRAELGDETFDKIQSLDKNQADIMKQSFDPNYPRDIKQESFEELLKPFGFKKVYSELLPDHRSDPKRIKTYDAYISDPKSLRADRFRIEYKVFKVYGRASIKYKASLWSEKSGNYILQLKTRFGYKSIDFSYKFFDHEIESDEGDRTVESIILAKEKENILAALEKL